MFLGPVIVRARGSLLLRDLIPGVGCARNNAKKNFHLVSTSWWCHGDAADGRGDGPQQCPEGVDVAARVLEGGEANAGRRRSEERLEVGREQLQSLMQEFKLDSTVRDLARKHLITGKKMYRDFMSSFGEHLMADRVLSSNKALCSAVTSILNGSAEKDTLFPFFLSHAQSLHPLIGPLERLLHSSHLNSPATWFPEARAKSRRIVYHAGPTNSGKTHSALQRFKAAKMAIYCAPLRLLAHEIFHRSNKEGVNCDLLTGEESQFGSEDQERPASRLSCTIEMAFSTSCHDNTYDICVIDEIQMIADPERGGAWTRALLGVVANEIHVCGHECALGLVKRIAETTGDTVEVHHYKRLSPLAISDRTLKGVYGSVRPGDCVVAFSRKKVFEIGQLIEKATKQSCALVYGDLPPAVRVKQADMFNDPASPCNVMVATDAIGMGLNLNIKRIVFYTLKKFDGNRDANLTPAHARQVAGRAGRYGKKHSKGLVTSFESKDYRLLRRLLQADVASTRKAGLYPTLDQIKHFSAFLPHARLHEVLALFSKLAEMDENYFLCDLSDQIDLAYELRDVDLDLTDMFQFTLAPVDLKKAKVVIAFVKFAEYFSEGKEISLHTLCECLGHMPSLAKTPLQLAELEAKYEVANLYLWLGMRFPEAFVAVEEARDLQEAVQEFIEKSLRHGPSLHSVAAQRRRRRKRLSTTRRARERP